jgi:hypothetical protein
VAKKAQKRPTTTKKAASKPAKAVGRPASKPATTSTPKAKAPAPAKRPLPSARPAAAAAGPTLGEQAERLRDDILRSKLTHPDPWRYAPKARGWGERVQVLVVQTVGGETPATRRALEALAAEVLEDRDFQEARRLF